MFCQIRSKAAMLDSLAGLVCQFIKKREILQNFSKQQILKADPGGIL